MFTYLLGSFVVTHSKILSIEQEGEMTTTAPQICHEPERHGRSRCCGRAVTSVTNPTGYGMLGASGDATGHGIIFANCVCTTCSFETVLTAYVAHAANLPNSL